jgi:hypothetical protein
MFLEQQQIASAVRTGLKMLSSDEIRTPNSWNADLTNLQNILLGIAHNQLLLQPVVSPTTDNAETEGGTE